MNNMEGYKNIKIEKNINIVEAGLEEKEEASYIVRRLMSNRNIRNLVLASLVSFGVTTTLASEAQNSDKNLNTNGTENAVIKNFEDNYLIKPDLKRWIHWVKTQDFIEYEKENKIKKIEDVSEEEMKKVYDYLEGVMDVWNPDELNAFAVKLYYAEESLGKRESLENKLTVPASLTAKMLYLYLNPERKAEVDEETEKILKQDAINLALEIKKVLSQSQ